MHLSDQALPGIASIAFHFAANSYARLCRITLDAAASGSVDSIRGYFVGIKSQSEKLENERKRERESSYAALCNVLLERIYISRDARINTRAYNPASIPRRGRANQITAE